MSPKKPVTAEIEETRAAAFQKFLTKMDKERPHEILRLDDESILEGAVGIPTGAISLDLALGCGGFPRGRVIELYGAEGSGKTSLALSVAANAQKQGGTVAFVDAENALTRELTGFMGVDPHNMMLFQPNSGEDAIDVINKILAAKAADIIIVDSVAALVPTAELEAETAQQFMGLHARMMSRWMRRVSAAVAESDTMLILINQVRANLGAYGTPDTTTGGRAIKFYASVRIEVGTNSGKRIFNTAKDQIGHTCVATIRKNKVGMPFKKAEYDLIYGQGISGAGSLLDVCVELGVVTRAGSSYVDTETSERLAVGKEKAKTRIKEDPELAERLTNKVHEILADPTKRPAVVITDDDDDEEAPEE